MNFTFGVLTFNSSDTLIETMESIKYQIETFGSGIDIYLVVSDDCSHDDTIYILKYWLEKNKNLFTKYLILESDINQGVCKNYARMIREIKTDDFLQIAGDDIICSQNIFEKSYSLKENELRVYMQYDLQTNFIDIDEYSLARQLFYREKKLSNNKCRQLLETFPPYRSIEVFFKRFHYSESCLNFMEKFRNFEDDTSLYYIFKHNPKTKFTFSNEPLILYRKSGTALTQSVGNPGQILFLDDLYKFRKITLKNEKKLFTKIILLFSCFHSFMLVHRFSGQNTIYKKMVVRNRDKVLNEAKRYADFSKVKEECTNFISNENLYIQEIKKRSDSFFKSIEERQGKK